MRRDLIPILLEATAWIAALENAAIDMDSPMREDIAVLQDELTFCMMKAVSDRTHRLIEEPAANMLRI